MVKTGKRLLALLLLWAMGVYAFPAMATDAVPTIAWSMRSASKGFNLLDDGTGITSMDADGKAVTPDNAAAVMTYPLGKRAFELAFDLVWSEENPVESDTDYGNADLYFFLNESNSLSDEGTSFYPAHNQVTLRWRHIDQRNTTYGVTGSGLVSLGRDANNNKITFANIREDRTTACRLKLADNTLTFVVYQDETVLKSIDVLTYDEGILGDDTLRYLGVAVNNNMAFSIKNLHILSTDYVPGEEVGGGGSGGDGEPDEEPPVVYDGQWELREMNKGLVTYGANGVTSLREDGTASAGSAAIWAEPLDGQRFKVTFDLIWSYDNLTEGQSGYLDNFLSIYLTDSVAFPEGTNPYLPAPGFRVETKHFQANDRVAEITTASADIVDFSGKDLNNLGPGNRSTLCLELNNGMLSLYVLDGDTVRGKITYAFAEGYFTEEIQRYVGFSIYGNLVCSVENVTIHETAGDTTETNSQAGAGMDFNGSNTYMISEEPIAAPTTMEAWVKVSALWRSDQSVGTLFQTDEAAIVGSTNGNFRIYFGSKSVKVTNVDLRTSTWMHLAAVCDRQQGKILCYVNGELVSSANETVETLTTASLAYLGNNLRFKSAFHGEVADLRLWTDVRTPEEIAANMYATVPADAEGLLANYLLTETETTTYTDRTGQSSDLLLKKRITYVDKPEQEEYDYTVAIIPDTQIMTGGYTSMEAYTALTQWLVDNKESEKIAFALHVGDFTNNPIPSQFVLAQQAMEILDGQVPYAFVPGNHDYDTDSSEKRDTSVYNTYFSYDKYRSESTFGGAYEEGKMDNTYWFFDAGEEKYMVVALEFGPRDSVLEWACAITEANADRHVIVLTHGNLDYDGELMDDTSENTPTNYMNGGYLDVAGDAPNNGDDVWEKYARKYAHIDMVISGHIYSDNIVTHYEVGDNGNTVCHMLVNAQRLDFDMWIDQAYSGIDGLGMIALLRFSENGEKVAVSYYSPYLDEYIGEQNQFTITLSETGDGTGSETGGETGEGTGNSPVTGEALPLAACGTLGASVAVAVCTQRRRKKFPTT